MWVCGCVGVFVCVNCRLKKCVCEEEEEEDDDDEEEEQRERERERERKVYGGCVMCVM